MAGSIETSVPTVRPDLAKAERAAERQARLVLGEHHVLARAARARRDFDGVPQVLSERDRPDRRERPVGGDRHVGRSGLRAHRAWVPRGGVDVRAVRKTRLVPLDEMRKHKALAKMVTLRPGNRLSITPVTESEWKYIATLI